MVKFIVKILWIFWNARNRVDLVSNSNHWVNRYSGGWSEKRDVWRIAGVRLGCKFHSCGQF